MQDFFDYLEYSISRTLANSADSAKRRCWCDGIMLPEIGEAYQVQRNSGNYNRGEAFISARAWIEEGRTKGQPASQKIYELKVILGEQALANYQAGKELQSCVPAEDKDDWIGLDIRNRFITVELL